MEPKKKNWGQLKRWKTKKDTLKSEEGKLASYIYCQKSKTPTNQTSAVLQLASPCPPQKDLEGVKRRFGVFLSRGAESIPC